MIVEVTSGFSANKLSLVVCLSLIQLLKVKDCQAGVTQFCIPTFALLKSFSIKLKKFRVIYLLISFSVQYFLQFILQLDYLQVFLVLTSDSFSQSAFVRCYTCQSNVTNHVFAATFFRPVKLAIDLKHSYILGRTTKFVHVLSLYCNCLFMWHIYQHECLPATLIWLGLSSLPRNAEKKFFLFF